MEYDWEKNPMDNAISWIIETNGSQNLMENRIQWIIESNK